MAHLTVLDTIKWTGRVIINQGYDDSIEFGRLEDARNFDFNDGFHVHSINLLKAEVRDAESKTECFQSTGTYAITVKKYMTQKSTPGFDFMERWNNDIPMPLMTMVGEKVKETKGMVYMKLHGDITAESMQTCLCCGRAITNDVSKFFGMGPICGKHNYVNPFSTNEELKEAVSKYRTEYLQKITWEGWVIKSAITNEVEL